ncbi:type III secretion system inner rod subunit SctI [Robbsia sp. Bb-Pol-6]|uniref:Type III secretion system inner rod subunit SctI n=1 Tax=Robbsia betulipollinis TaxID=2981849 RepID=A0ABT3ZT53_9BURK|nr:type III secretion system inner rod subunit SctI [Robbsia betulipollinis]MCY0389746.1 type III secretion system inner rod subunit SctI [Robbsia betulipollinis]
MAAMTEGVRTAAHADARMDEGAGGGFDATPAPAAHDATRFAHALHRARGIRDEPNGIDDRSLPGRAHALRDGLRQAATALDRDWRDATGLVAASLQAGRWGPAGMLALQGRMLQVSLQMDLASKLVQKSTQAVDQLVRIQ